jgi:hypothetical protein
MKLNKLDEAISAYERSSQIRERILKIAPDGLERGWLALTRRFASIEVDYLPWKFLFRARSLSISVGA